MQLKKVGWQTFLYGFDNLAKIYLNMHQNKLKNKCVVESSRKQILLVKTGSIGDFIIWLDIARQWREIYGVEKYRLILLCNCPPIKEIFDELAYFDEIIFIEDIKCHTKLGYRMSLFQQLRIENIETAINGDYVNSYRNNNMFIKSLDGSVCKIGIKSEGENWLESKKQKIFSEVIDVSGSGSTEIEHYASVLSAVSKKTIKANYPIIPKLCESVIIENDYFVVSPNSKDIRRNWGADKYIQLVKKVHKTTKWTPVLVGGVNDMRSAEYIEEALRKLDIECKNLTGKTTMAETVEVIRDAKIHIGNDSGNSHIANAVQTDSFVLLGGGHYEKYFPYKENMQIKGVKQVCIFKKMECYFCDWCCYKEVKQDEIWPCIEAISVEEAWNRIELYLKEVLK